MPINEPFEYLTFGGTFSRTFSLWLDRFDFFTSIAAVVLVPFTALTISVGLVSAIWIVETEEIPDFHPKHLPLIIFIFGMQYFVYSLATIIGRGAISLGVARMYVGQPVNMMDCLKEAWAKKCTLLTVSLFMGSAMLFAVAILATFIFIAVAFTNAFSIFLAVVVSLCVCAAGFYGYIGIVLTSPSIMIENFSGPIQGMKRSWELATGSRCYLFWTLFCLWFLNDMVSRALLNIFVGGDIMDVVFSLAGVVVAILPLLIYFPLHAIIETIMYLNLRVGRESMNHQVLSGDLMNDGSALSRRFRNDDYEDPSSTNTDYRHVPLIDQEEAIIGSEMT